MRRVRAVTSVTAENIDEELIELIFLGPPYIPFCMRNYPSENIALVGFPTISRRSKKKIEIEGNTQQSTARMFQICVALLNNCLHLSPPNCVMLQHFL